MAAWKVDPGDEAADSQDQQNGEANGAQPLFGKFRRASSGDPDGDAKARSMSEMWGFNGDAERREARRRKFWSIPQQDPSEDDEPWKQFRGASEDVYDETPPPAPVPLWSTPPPTRAVPGYETIEADDEVEPIDDEPWEPDPIPVPISSAGDQRNGWRSFLAEVPPVFAHPAPILPEIPEVAPLREEPVLAFAAPQPFQAPVLAIAPASSLAPEVLLEDTKVSAPATHASPLVIETQADMTAAVSVCTHLGRDWQAAFEPAVADIVIRAFARAIGREPTLRDLDTGVAILDLGVEQGMGCLLKDAGKRSFKNAVATLAEQAAEPLNDFAVSFTDYGMLGISRATPRLLPGQALALAFGARTFGPVQLGDGVTWKPIANLCLAYDGELVNDGAAARVLARMRTLVEMPDDLLTD